MKEHPKTRDSNFATEIPNGGYYQLSHKAKRCGAHLWGFSSSVKECDTFCNEINFILPSS